MTLRAEATPAFARRYRTGCRTCHQWSFPTLNSWGTRFRQNGYQLPEGAEDPARAANMIEPGTIDDRGAVFATPPLSFRARVLGTWAEGDDEERRLGVEVPYVRAVAGGSLFEDVSTIFAADLAPAPALHFLTVGLHDVLGNGGLSILAGKLLLSGFQRPGHRSVTRLASPLASVAVGKNPFMLEGDHYGVTVAGRPGWGPLAYELSIANGAPGAPGQTGTGAPGALGRLTFTLGREHTLGVFGYAARARLHTDEGGIEREWDDRLVLAGGDLEIDLWRLSLYAAGLFGLHDDSHGDGHRVRYQGLRAEALWAIDDVFSAIIRVDAVESHDDGSLDARLLTGHLGALVLTSLRASVEGSFDLLEGHHDSRLLAFLEVAL